jgi:restriction system protein
VGYSGAVVVELAEEVLAKAFRGVFPIESDSMQAYAMWGGGRALSTPEEVLAVLQPMIEDLERRLPEGSSGAKQ